MSHEDWDDPVEVESFDHALPVRVERAPEPERYIIGCCFMDQGQTLDQMVQAGLSSGDFIDESLGKIFGVMRIMREKKLPIDLETLVQELGPRINDVGGIVTLMDLDDPIKIGTTSKASHYVGKILQESANRRELARARDIIDRATRGEDVGSIQIKSIIPKRKPSEFLLPQDGDRSVLLGNRFLNRGDGGILVGSSGMGKSSASIQMAICWSLGLPFQGIKPNGPLKILIIQSEDSDGDIGEVMLSMRHMMKLDQDQIGQVDDRVRIVCDRVSRGRRFIDSLAIHIKEFEPDLVIINPLQAFIDGDVTESRDLGQFLRDGLNGLNDNKFGYLLVHHTTKPATGKDRGERQWHEVMYDMAGGAELINWARFVMSLRATETEGNFNLVLAKRGRRAGVVRMVEHGAGMREEVITTIPLRHAQGSIEIKGRLKPVGIIFWEPREPDQKNESPSPRSGRPEKFSYNDYRNVFPPKSSSGKNINEIHRDLMSNGEIQKKNLHNVLKRWADQGDVEIIQVHGHPTRYRASL